MARVVARQADRAVGVELDPVLGHAESEGLDRGPDPGADAGQSEHAFGEVDRLPERAEGGVGAGEVDRRELPEVLPEPAGAALDDEQPALADDQGAGLGHGEGSRPGRCDGQRVLDPQGAGAALGGDRADQAPRRRS